MSMGGSPDIPDPAPVVAPVQRSDQSVTAAAEASRRRIRAQQGRQSTFLVPVGGMTPRMTVGDV